MEKQKSTNGAEKETSTLVGTPDQISETPVANDVALKADDVAKENAAPVEKEKAAPSEKEVKAEKADKSGDKDPGKDGEKPMTKGRRIANAVILAIQIAFVIFAITICLVVMLNPSSNDKVSPVGLKLLPVLTGSMDGDKKDSFPKGALVFAKTPKDHGAGLKEGDIVTFSMIEEVSGQRIIVTHRIVEVVTIEEGLYKYRTQGDANPMPDDALKLPGDILAVYVFHINGLGSALTWVRTGYNFIYVIIIPLGLLLIYNIYLVAQIVVESKMKKAKAAAAKAAKDAALASIDEEEIKRRAIEEYLKSQGMGVQPPSSEDKGEEK